MVMTRGGTGSRGTIGGGSGALIGILTVAGAVLMTLALLYYDVDPWGAIGLPLVLAAITVPLLLRTRLAKVDRLGALLIGGLAMKFLGAAARYILDYEWYNRSADAVGYMSAGAKIAEQYQQGRLEFTDLIPSSQSTEFLRELSGLTQVVVGGEPLANYMLFSWVAFLGMVAMVAAARLAVPGLRVRRYAALVLFMPTMLLWSSAIGKDAIMVLALGLFCLGTAKLTNRLISGLLPLACGFTLMAYVRPHLALVALGALSVAVALGRQVALRGTSSSSFFLRATVLVAVVVAFSFAVSQASEVLPGFSPDGSINISETLEVTSTVSGYGGSEIGVTAPNSPIDYPYAFLTVMFRPFIFEASNFNAFLASVEGTVLIALFVLWRRDVVNAVRRALREQYLMMVGLYILAFGFAWASMANLGLIARQRAQVLPLLVLFLCVPAALASRSAVAYSDTPVPEPKHQPGGGHDS